MKRRRTLQEELVIAIGGLVGLTVAIGRLSTPLAYPVGDQRRNASVELAISAWIGFFGTIGLVAGISMLVLRYRRRR